MAQQNQGGDRSQSSQNKDAGMGRNPSQQQDRGQADMGRQQQGSNPSKERNQGGQAGQDDARSRSKLDQDDPDTGDRGYA